MGNIMSFVNTFVTEDYFIIFLAIMIMILIVLIMALIKTRNQYYEEMSRSYSLEDDLLKLAENEKVDNEVINEVNKDINTYEKKEEITDIEDFYSLVDKYELNEEEHAVISTDELERRKQEKFDELGVSDNEAMIQKYEEEQEKKAIISYEQLLKNASNIKVSYKEEDTEDGSPKINKIEVAKKEVSEAQSYIEEEQFLKILKDFRTSLPG